MKHDNIAMILVVVGSPVVYLLAMWLVIQVTG